MQHVYTARINLDDYPDYVQDMGSGTTSSGTPNALDRPGLHLAEAHALRGVRYAAGLGYVLTMLYFYGYHRPSLPFADRPLAKLHHYFFPSAGYTAPVGLLGGLTYGAYAESAQVTEDAVRAAKLTDERAARTAYAQYTQRRQAALQRLTEREAWWVSLAIGLHLMEDPKPQQLQRMNFGEPSRPAPTRPRGGERTWEEFVKPYSMLGVQQRSAVRDARFYRGGAPFSCMYTPYEDLTATGNTTPEAAAHAGKKGDARRASQARQPPPRPTPPEHPAFTKDQMDGIVSGVLTRRHDAEEERWKRTGGRFSLYGIVTMLIAWNQGNLFFRLSMGLGAGAVAGATISAMKLDDIWTHV